MFTWREYSVANGSRNPILLLSNALADIILIQDNSAHYPYGGWKPTFFYRAFVLLAILCYFFAYLYCCGDSNHVRRVYLL